MTTQQPKALRLAAHAEANSNFGDMKLIATELRRLHESNTELRAALIVLLADAENCGGYSLVIHNIARAAIAKAERTTT